MQWNWQHPGWPNFTWDRSQIATAEEQFLLGSGIVIGSVKHLSGENQKRILVELMSGEAVSTSKIEGEVLNRDSVQSSIQRQLGLAADKRRVSPAEQGIAEMMVDLYRSFGEPLSEEILFAWHRMITAGRRDLVDIGRYRTSKEPMQIVSGRIGAPKVHFEAPPSKRVAAEMNRFIAWFNQTAPGAGGPLPAITRAGIAHLHFECIHPLEDGNGRLGRAIAEKAAAQVMDHPMHLALAPTILAHQKRYYEALERANRGIDVTEWLTWFAGIALEAQQRSIALVEFVISKTRLLDTLRGKINPRQERALLRMFQEGPDGFKGGLSAGNYMTITGASPATTTRDLADLVEKGALFRSGELKHARYALNFPKAHRVYGPLRQPDA
jgi:Fic family protein